MALPAKPLTKLQVWLLAARPRTLPAAAAPVIIGSALAYYDGAFRLLPALGALMGALLLQIGANFANDVFDFQKGTDDAERLGPTRVTQSGLLAPAAVKTGMWVVFALAAIIGVYLTWASGWWILAIGLAAVLAAILYSGGPAPYGYIGLGEVVCFLFFGVAAVMGTYYVQAVRFSTASLVGSIPVGLLIVAILAVNNLRDIHTDRATGKKTLAVRIGERAARMEYALLLLTAYLVTLLQAVFGFGSAWLLLPLITLPMAVNLIVFVRKHGGKALNLALARTGLLTLYFSLAYAAAIVLKCVFPV